MKTLRTEAGTISTLQWELKAEDRKNMAAGSNLEWDLVTLKKVSQVDVGQVILQQKLHLNS